MRKLLSRYVQIVDALNERVKVFGWIVVILALLTTFEVVARDVFNSPTIWSSEVSKQLLAAMAIMAGGYALLHRIHVRTDLLYQRWSTKTKAVIDLVTSPLALAYLGVMLYAAGKSAWKSVISLENISSYFGPPAYPLKLLIVIGVFIFLLQAVVSLIRNFLILATKK